MPSVSSVQKTTPLKNNLINSPSNNECAHKIKKPHFYKKNTNNQPLNNQKPFPPLSFFSCFKINLKIFTFLRNFI